MGQMLGLKVVHMLQESIKLLQHAPSKTKKYQTTSTFMCLKKGFVIFYFNEKLKTCNIKSQKEGTCHTSSRGIFEAHLQKEGVNTKTKFAEFSEEPPLPHSLM